MSDKPLICYKCFHVNKFSELRQAARINKLSKENASKFKQCSKCPSRTFYSNN